MLNAEIITKYESEVRYYSRIFPAIFTRAKDSYLFDRSGKRYIDFFSGAGALNYGHNNSQFKKKILSYIEADGIMHSLDMMTLPKLELIKNFNEIILKKRNLNYKIQFTGPTGTNAVEAALKLARKATGRKNIFYFSNSFHGMSMGALSVTPKKNRAGIPLEYTMEFPFYQKNSAQNSAIENYLKTIDKAEYPAAIIMETVQAGHVHIDDGSINRMLEREGQRLRAARGHQHDVTTALQQHAERITHGFVIVDDEERPPHVGRATMNA